MRFIKTIRKTISKVDFRGISANLNKSLFRLLKMIKKEFRLLRTDPMNLLIAIILPPVIITLYGSLMNFPQKTQPISTIVVTYDSNTFINPNNYTETKIDDYAVPYIKAVNKSLFLDLIDVYNTSVDVYSMETARNDLISGKTRIIIVIPVDFSEMLKWGLPGIIECISDSSDVQRIQDNLNAVQDSIKIFVNDTHLNPQFVLQRYEDFSIPSKYNFKFNYYMTLMLSFVIFGISQVLTILVVVQEKPIPRLLLTPVKRIEILISKYITYTIILLFQITLLLFSCLSQGFYLVGSVFDLFIALFMVGFTGLSMGIFISSLSKTKTEANQLFFAFFIVIVILSGIFIPLESMPEYLRVFAYLLPLSHGHPMIKGIVTKGKSALGFDFFCLLGISIFFVAMSFVFFMKRKYEV